MKRLLFCAGILALAASCTEEMDTLSVQQQSKGITFVATDGNDAATRGHFEETEDGEYYAPFWWAEQDRIAILSTNTNKNLSTAWEDATQIARYKATKSERTGQFTSIDDLNLLTFNNAAKKSEFLAVYPADLTIDKTVDSKGFIIKDLNNLTVQTQNNTTGNGIYENMLKYSYSVAQKENEYDAVGEKVNLDFQRVLSGMVFKTANADRYTKGGATSTFGNLQTIKAELTGNGEESNPKAKTPALIYNSSDATLTLKMPATVGGTIESEFNAGSVMSTTTPTIVDNQFLTSTVNINKAWNDDARAYMITLPLKMAELEKAENLKVTYSFANIEFVKTYSLEKKDWEAGKFYKVNALDINSYDYLLTNAAPRTLIVNKGNFSDVYVKSGTDEGKIKWEGVAVPLTEVGSIIVAKDVNMTEADVKGLNKFTNLTNVELNGVTKIPADAFKGLAAKLETIVLPAVTEINASFVNANFSNLKELNLASYNFANETVNGKLFDGTKTSLETLNISGVESMTPVFGIERTLSFQGFGVLNSVTVKDGVKLSPNAFSDCDQLATVNGIVDLTNGTSAFSGDETLAKININGTVIPANAFKDCKKLTQVLKDGKQVVPTVVRANAFENVASQAANNANFYMDLSQATTIEKAAFMGSKLTSDKSGSDILTVGATAANEEAFANTNVKMVKFTEATKIYNDVLKNTSNLIQVKFVKPFTYGGGNTTVSGNTFGPNTANMVLFVCSEQTGWSGTTLTLGSGNYAHQFIFKSITIED